MSLKMKTENLMVDDNFNKCTVCDIPSQRLFDDRFVLLTRYTSKDDSQK